MQQTAVRSRVGQKPFWLRALIQGRRILGERRLRRPGLRAMESREAEEAKEQQKERSSLERAAPPGATLILTWWLGQNHPRIIQKITKWWEVLNR